MKKMIQIALLKVKLALKDKTSLLLMFVAPIVFITVIAMGFKVSDRNEEATSMTYPVGVVNNDQGAYSKELMKLLQNETAIILNKGDYNKVKKNVEDNNYAIGIVIPEGFSEAIETGNYKPIELIKLQDSERTVMIKTELDNNLQQLLLGRKAGVEAGKVVEAMASISLEEQAEVQLNVEKNYLDNLEQPQLGYSINKTVKATRTDGGGLSAMAIGILVLFIMFFVSNGASSMFEEKEIGTWNRVKSTPTKNFSVLGGYILGNFLLGWIQVGTLIVFSKTQLDLNWGKSPLALCLLFSCFLLAVIGLGTALASFVKTKHQLTSLTPLIIMPTSLIAGCMWPVDIMPDFMIKLSNFMPQTWVLKGMTNLTTRGAAIEEILLPSMILLLFAGVFFGTGLLLMNRNENNA